MKTSFLRILTINPKNLIIVVFISSLLVISGCAKTSNAPETEIAKSNLDQTSDQTITENQSTIDELSDEFKKIYSGENLENETGYNCDNPENQTIAESISQTFEITGEEIINWHCIGYEFEDILMALETNNLSGVSIEELLQKTQNQKWEEIWEDIGFSIEE